MQTFQDLILQLQAFWAARGCLIWQPYNQVVGAGTMNPATFLRVLGPEPWNVAYVEPSARPDDGRFGQNPNRLYTHTQFQVILKPSPERSQELYLESLEAIGIDLAKHDIRFVEDNWAQPAIGAWGLGWEVWLDGLEITQYTYFQQVGGVTLDPVSLELTYGLERIAMALQGARTVFDLKWDGVRTYGDVKLSDERERSDYAFNHADVEELHELFEMYERECKKTLARGLVLPSHDYVLGCSNVFNLLDTRGAIGVTERARYLGRMRGLAEQVAKAYVAQREALGFPWKTEVKPQPDEISNPNPAAILHPSSFVIEIGTEELPADNVQTCERQLRDALIAALHDARIEHGEITTIATPRRTAAIVRDVAPMTRGLDQWMRGPAAKVAFDKDGQPTGAAIGFAKRFGVEAKDLVVKDEAGGSYIFARKVEAGKPAAEALAQALPQVLGSIKFEKTMRWNASNVAFARPINWIVALLGEHVIPFEFAGVRSDNESTGSRGEGSPRFRVRHADEYASAIAAHSIVGDREARRENVRAQAEWIATGIGGHVADDADLLDEVTDLVEQPSALLCEFPREYLALPAPVLISVMRKKQRYFTVLDRDGKLMPNFITVRNGSADGMDAIRKGNEDVVNARFADAAYFYRDDIAKPLDAHLPRLDTIVFQAKLGSMLDKTKRIEANVDNVATLLGAWASDSATAQSPVAIARKAAKLCKADLATNMVVEITALQGTMGREYHLLTSRDDDKAAVADAIFEHYLPRFAGDRSPNTLAGLIVGLCDKLDSIAGLFAVGLAPKGNADPFALRRAAIGIVQNLVANDKSFSLRRGLDSAAKLLPAPMSADALNAAHAFIIERERQQLLDEGFAYDVVDAVLAEQGDDPARARAAVAQLGEAVRADDWATTLAAFARCARIVRGQAAEAQTHDAARAKDAEPAAMALTAAVDALPRATDVASLVANLRSLVAPINAFFEQVMVMSDDAQLRASRLALLAWIVAQTKGIADMSQLKGF